MKQMLLAMSIRTGFRLLKVPALRMVIPAGNISRTFYAALIVKIRGVKDRMFTAILNGFDDYLIDE